MHIHHSHAPLFDNHSSTAKSPRGPHREFQLRRTFFHAPDDLRPKRLPPNLPPKLRLWTWRRLVFIRGLWGRCEKKRISQNIKIQFLFFSSFNEALWRSLAVNRPMYWICVFFSKRISVSFSKSPVLKISYYI